MAIGWWPGGYEPAAAVCRLDSDGRLTVITGAADMTGVETGFAAIAAEAFGVDPSRVRVVNADTSSAPYAGTSGGSKVTYTVGRAVERAALEARERLLEVAADELEISPLDLEIVDGAIQPVGVPAKALPIDELAPKILSFGSRHMPVEGHGRSAQTQAPQAAAHLSHVRVDPETGAVTVLAHVIAQDVGRALNPALVEGQMQGGTVQGLGWALLEELAHDDHGQLTTGTFMDYAMPTAVRNPRDRCADRRGACPRGSLRRQGRRRGPDRRRGRCRGQRDRRRHRRGAADASADDPPAGLAGGQPEILNVAGPSVATTRMNCGHIIPGPHLGRSRTSTRAV